MAGRDWRIEAKHVEYCSCDLGCPCEKEVLVSRIVTDLVAGAGLKFTERGVFDLKGISGQWGLFAAAQ